MSMSARAILMRFRGDVTHACDYCETIAWTYGYLTREYRGYREEILNHRMKRTRENGDNVSSKSTTKMNSSVFSSGFSGYIRVRPPEPKKEGCKDEGSHSENENPEKKLAQAS